MLLGAETSASSSAIAAAEEHGGRVAEVRERRRVERVVPAAGPGPRRRRPPPAGAPGPAPRLARGSSVARERAIASARSSSESASSSCARLPGRVCRPPSRCGRRASRSARPAAGIPGTPAGDRRAHGSGRLRLSIASATCSALIRSSPARSAIVRDEPQAAIPAAGAQAELAVALARGSRLAARIQMAVATQLARRHVRVGAARPRRSSCVAPCRQDSLPDRRRSPRSLLVVELLRRRRIHGQGDVDPVGESAAELRHVTGDGGGMTLALARVGSVAAGAGIRGRHQHEAAGEGDGARGPGDGDHALLERHPQGLQRVATELTELVEEEDAAMGPRHLTRARRRAAADQRPAPRPCDAGP